MKNTISQNKILINDLITQDPNNASFLLTIFCESILTPHLLISLLSRVSTESSAYQMYVSYFLTCHTNSIKTVEC
jgi:hypothetical protein